MEEVGSAPVGIALSVIVFELTGNSDSPTNWFFVLQEAGQLAKNLKRVIQQSDCFQEAILEADECTELLIAHAELFFDVSCKGCVSLYLS